VRALKVIALVVIGLPMVLFALEFWAGFVAGLMSAF
jgi:hypothetical protein